MDRRLIIAVDFDGTCVEHRYPEIGAELPGCVETLRELADRGHELVLCSCRRGIEEREALGWLSSRGIPIGLPPGGSGKMLYDLFIEDRAFGCPLRDGSADWSWIRAGLMMDGLIEFSLAGCGMAMSRTFSLILRDAEDLDDIPAMFRGALMSTPLARLDAGDAFRAAAKAAHAFRIGVCAAKGSRIAEGESFFRTDDLDTDGKAVRIIQDTLLPFLERMDPGRCLALIEDACQRAIESDAPFRGSHQAGEASLVIDARPMWVRG